MTTIRTLASGSSGNAAILSRGETHLLIDMGISCRRVCQSLSALAGDVYQEIPNACLLYARRIPAAVLPAGGY